MRLELCGHDYKYAVEQIMLMLFPNERPEYGQAEGLDPSAKITLHSSASYISATTHLTVGGKSARGLARVRVSEITDETVRDRLLQKIIKSSFYKAAAIINGAEPEWGSLTGIRPAKIASSFLEKGFTPKGAEAELQRVYRVSKERSALCVSAALESLRVNRSLSPRDIALYVGIPFCPTRCAYCSFVSHSVERSMKLVEPFVEKLLHEIEETAAIVSSLGLNIVSVYFGGGTPTTLSAEQLTAVISRLRSSFDLSKNREFTVEAGRPDTITEAKLEALLDGGVDRISVNPQTMSDKVLEAIGRRHTSDDVCRAMELVRRSGFNAVNMDLIAGLPLDTPEGFADTLGQVMAFEPENITVHTLSLKKGSRITLEGTPIPDGEAVSKMLDHSKEKLSGAGYAPYYLYKQKFMSGGFENVGWSKKGYENLYNIAIMEELCTIVALGGGGVTKLLDTKSGKLERIFNAKYPYEYIDRIDSEIEKKQRLIAFYGEKSVL